jgi:lysophospholipid acyltransferase (LPLAT)-like uncharacterized protein
LVFYVATSENNLLEKLSHTWRRIEGIFLGLYAHLLAKTVRISMEGAENFEKAFATGHPILFSLWHQQLNPFFAFAIKHTDVSKFVVIVVGDDRGDILGQMGYVIGAKTMVKVDMGGNPMAAGRGVLNVIKALKGGGNYTVLAPDGPDGPAFEPKRGATFIALKSKAIIVPFGGFTKHGYQMKRWDRYLLPLPFGKMHFVFGEPINVDRKMKEEDLEVQLVEALHAARNRAMSLAGVL